MFSSIRKAMKLRWKSTENPAFIKRQDYLFFSVLMGLLEDILFWKKTWLSVTFILLFNALFIIGSYQETKFSAILIYMSIVTVCADGLELWLKHKHRTLSSTSTRLGRLLARLANQQQATYENGQLKYAVEYVIKWLKLHWNNYIQLRDNNNTKAFLMVNIVFAIICILGKCLGGGTVLYLMFMVILTLHITAPVALKFVKKTQLHSDSDTELDSLIPEITDGDLHLLSIEPEYQIDERQSLDYWKPEDELPGEDVSDSSDNSSSLDANLSMEKHSIEKDAGTSDSSDEEFIPLAQLKEPLQSTLKVEPAGTWSSSAFNALYNLTGAMANMVYTADNKRQGISRVDSSDGFEIIDKNEL